MMGPKPDVGKCAALRAHEETEHIGTILARLAERLRDDPHALAKLLREEDDLR
jgi:hypothetical protein